VKRRRRAVVCALSAVAFSLSLGPLATATAQAAAITVTPLTLVNGWTGAPFGTAPPSVLITSGIVHFKGAIAGGTSALAFTLPAAFRPSKSVFIPVDLCNATNGRLDITPSGQASVEAESGTFSNAQCFTSLDGAWFAKSASSFTALTLQNGWTNAPFGTSNAAVRNIGGIIHFKGAIATSGTNPVVFTLPATFRPTSAVYVPVDLCNATNGRLFIQSNGVVTVQAEGGTFSNAACFTSLDGASFAKSGQFFTKLTLINGWTNAPFGTSKAQVHGGSGVIHFKGAIATSGTSAVAFKLPKAFRPHKNVFVKVDLCNATNGRLDIAPGGTVSVQAEGGTFTNAQCFTSLDGVTFVP
jgi:hypothetical protein